MRKRLIYLRAVAEGISLTRVLRPSRPGLRILIYHSVGHHAHGDTQGIFGISPQRFRHHVHLLTNLQDCRTVPLQPLDIPQQHMQVAVTFDDGYRDNLHIAAPILIEHGIPFTVFVSSDFIRNRIDGFLTPEELRELAGLPGVIIGAHGKTHRPLTVCNDKELENELTSSKHYLEDVLGHSVSAVAYPYGAADVRVRDEARRLGYDLGVCTRFDINMPDRDPLLLCRCTMERDDTPRVLRQKLHGDWDWSRWRSRDPLHKEGSR